MSFYLKIGNKEQGPISSKELKEAANSGKIKKETPIRKANSKKWYTAQDVKGLFPIKVRKPVTFKPYVDTFQTNIAGVTFKNKDGSSRQKLISRCLVGEDVLLEAEPNNRHDPYAMKVLNKNGKQLGYLKSAFAAVVYRKKNRKQGARHYGFISRIGLWEDIWYCELTIIECNDVTSEEDVKSHIELEKELAIKKSRSLFVKAIVFFFSIFISLCNVIKNCVIGLFEGFLFLLNCGFGLFKGGIQKVKDFNISNKLSRLYNWFVNL